jgi:PRTRC genetic system protein C
MTDQLENPINQPAAPLTCVFKIGANRVVEDEPTARLTNEQVRELLKATYPEVANATIRERTDAEAGLQIVEFLPQPGRKG